MCNRDNASQLQDRLLAIGDGGGTSGITDLTRRGKTCPTATSASRKEWECARETILQKVVAEEGGEGAPGSGAEILLQPVVQTMVSQAVSQQPMEGNHSWAVHKELWEGLTLKKLMEDCLLWKGPPRWSSGRMWEVLLPRSKEWQRQW